MSKNVRGMFRGRTFCQVIICATGTVRLKMNPVRCVAKYSRAKSDSMNCWMSETRSSGRMGRSLLIPKSGCNRKSYRCLMTHDAEVFAPDSSDRVEGWYGTWIGRPVARFLIGLMFIVASAREC